MVKIVIKKSNAKNKKYTSFVPAENGKVYKVHFGDSRYSDYLQHKDPERRKRYIDRHKKREQKYWSHVRENLFKPSYYARYILWGPHTSMAKNKKFIEEKQNLNIK